MNPASYPLSKNAFPLRAGLRGLARVVLMIWLFTLTACFYGDLSPHHQAEEVSLAQMHGGHSGHDDSSQHEEDCCTVLQNLLPFSKVSNFQIPLQRLIYVLLPVVIFIQALSPVIARTRYADPPGKPRPALIANSLWPNAPPR